MDKKKQSSGKISLAMLKGKPITSSVPSIRFNANAEEIEELHVSDDEGMDSISDITPLTDIGKKCPVPKYKRSCSIDTTNSTDASPPSDPWRFFSDFKRNITKSVEGKLTEYKTRTVEGEGSPKINKTLKEGAKDSSSLSDSEELSESSISRTCGITSTTDGVEMSSDDETPSISEKDKKSDPSLEEDTSAQKQKIILIRDNKVHTEKLVPNKFLENLQNINMGIESTEDFVESGIDALSQIDNIDVDEDAVIIKEVSGEEIKEGFFKNNNNKKEVTIFSPKGFVDLRCQKKKSTWFTFINNYRTHFLLLLAVLLYFLLPLTQYMYGFIAGNLVMFITALFYINYFYDNKTSHNTTILEIPAIKEHHAAIKHEGWINEYPDKYDPNFYHISKTQSVHLRLQEALLKISHTNQKIPKRSMWNEPEYKLNFTRHRIYNLVGASITLLPPGLTKIRHWSKKYPICISLDKDQLNVDYLDKKRKSNEDSSKGRKCNEAQIFSKLSDEISESEMEYTSYVHETPRDSPDIGPENLLPDVSSMEDDEKVGKTEGDESTKTVIYLFARTDREKEHWFRRLKMASRKMAEDHGDAEPNLNDFKQVEYLRFMSKYLQSTAHSSSYVLNDETQFFDTQWLNALMSRVFYDCMNNESFISKVKERVQRKLSTIKLPYFIEEITITELSLGNTPPCISKAEKPRLDEWGLWVYLHTNYEGHAVVTLQTKLNLMKLKQPQEPDKNQPVKSPIFHSDVDDSAESSSDEDSPSTVQTEKVAETEGSPTSRSELGKSKKFIRMVDRIAESRIFQVASEYKYIKKAIEGVSNTDLGLKVELKCLEGCLVLNVASPPTDRVWVGFRPSPKLQLNAHPIVGERNINFLQVTNWIEKKLYKEFQKILVFPNMEDIYIPVMTQVLPE